MTFTTKQRKNKKSLIQSFFFFFNYFLRIQAVLFHLQLQELNLTGLGSQTPPGENQGKTQNWELRSNTQLEMQWNDLGMVLPTTVAGNHWWSKISSVLGSLYNTGNSVPQLGLESTEYLDKDRILKFRINSGKKILEIKLFRSPKVDPGEEMVCWEDVALNTTSDRDHLTKLETRRGESGVFILFCFLQNST